MKPTALIMLILLIGISCAELKDSGVSTKPTPTVNPVIVEPSPEPSKCERENEQLKDELSGLRQRLYDFTCDCGAWYGESDSDI